MIKISAQEYDTFRLFLQDHFQRHFNLVFVVIHALQDKCILMRMNLFLKNADHRLEKGVANPLNQYDNGIALQTFQIPGTVIGDKLILADGFHDHVFRALAYSGIIVNRPRYSTHTDTTLFRYIFNRYTIHRLMSFRISNRTALPKQ